MHTKKDVAGSPIIVVLYVDDMLLVGPNEKQIDDFRASLNASFEMSNLGLLHHYLGIKLKPINGGISKFRHFYASLALKSANLLLLPWR